MGRNRRKHRTRKELLGGQSGSNDTRGSRSGQPDVAEGFHREGSHHEGYRHGGFGPEVFMAFQLGRAAAMPSLYFHLGIATHIATSSRSSQWGREEFQSDSSDEEFAAEAFHRVQLRRERYRRERFCHEGFCDSEIHGNQLMFNENISVVSREEWKAKKPKHVPDARVSPFSIVFVGCFNGNIFPRSCEVIKIIQAMQSHQMKYLDDILCHFVVANDGKIYEGRGWDRKGEDQDIIHIDFIVNNIEDIPSKEELDGCKKIIGEGVRLGKIHKDYCLITKKNHRLYDEMVSWDNFSPSGCP